MSKAENVTRTKYYAKISAWSSSSCPVV